VLGTLDCEGEDVGPNDGFIDWLGCSDGDGDDGASLTMGLEDFEGKSLGANVTDGLVVGILLLLGTADVDG
jgi:hypothetical protein